MKIYKACSLLELKVTIKAAIEPPSFPEDIELQASEKNVSFLYKQTIQTLTILIPFICKYR
jgi:hypothetical protein